MIRRNRRRDSGQILVEFALCLPLIAILLACALDLGLLMWKDQMLARTARDGALFASRLSTGVAEWQEAASGDTITVAGFGTVTVTESHEERTMRYILGVSQGTGLTAAQVSIIPLANDSDLLGNDSIEVVIEHPHRFIAPMWTALGWFSSSGLGEEFRLERSWKTAFISNVAGTAIGL